MPLFPGDHDEIEQQVDVYPGRYTRGVELIANIAIRLHEYWKDTVNLPIRAQIIDRRLPFRDFAFYTVPQRTAGAVLTPLKAGIVMMWIMDKCLGTPTWPGYITATIWDATPAQRHARTVGKLIIANDPISHTGTELPLSNIGDTEKELDGKALPPATASGGSLQLPGNASDSHPLGIPPDLERRWLKCWTMLFNRGMKYSPVGSFWATEGTPHGPRPSDTLYFNYPCWGKHGSAEPGEDRIRFWSRPLGGPDRIPDVLWRDVELALLDWITKAAETPDGWMSPRAVGRSPTGADEARIIIELAGVDTKDVATA